MKSVLQVLPFQNMIEYIKVSGATLMEMLEHSVTEYYPANPAGRFLQVSGK